MEAQERLFKTVPSEAVRLYPKQEALIAKIRAAYAGGAKMPCVQASTGFGKSVVAGYIIRNAIDKGAKRVVMIVDSLTLIDQLIDTLEGKFDLDVGVIQGFNPRFDMSKRVQIATPQTLSRRFNDKDELKRRYYVNYDVSLIIADECHLKYRGIDEAISYWKCKGMGLTATPFAKGMANTYDALVKAESLEQLIEDGDLAAYKAYSHSTPDFKGCKVSPNGDIQADAKYDHDLIGDVFDTWKSKCSERLTIGFATTIGKCEAFAKLFRDNGISSIATHSKLTDDDATDIINRFKSGEIRVLWSVAKLIKGFDAPEASCLIDCQPTKSLMRHVQKGGRVLRKHPDKKFAIILDHAGNMQRNGFYEDAQIDELSDGSEKESKDQKDQKTPDPVKCYKCGYSMKPAILICPECGTERKKTSKRDDPDEIETAEGELVEMKKSTSKRNKDTSWEDKAAFSAGLHGYARDKGYSVGWVAHKYKERFGVWPNDKRVKHVNPEAPNAEVQKFIQHLNIKSARGRR